MTTQYVAVKFKPWDRRTYTYHHDGEPIAVGDQVEVRTPSEGPKTVTVESVGTAKPPFRTKPIDRVISRAADDDDQGELASA